MVAMNDLIKIRNVEVLEGYSLRLSFSDGVVKDVDLTEVLARAGCSPRSVISETS